MHEHVRWFGKAQRLSFEIVHRRRIALLGSGEELGAVLRALLLVPDVEPVILDWDQAYPRRYDYRHLRGIGAYLYGIAGTARIAAVLRSARVIWPPVETTWGWTRFRTTPDRRQRPAARCACEARAGLRALDGRRRHQRLGVAVTQVLTEDTSARRFPRALDAVAGRTRLAELPSLLRE